MTNTQGAEATLSSGRSGASDQDLVVRARSGEDAAFDELLRRHYGRVVNFAYRLQGNMDDAEDIAQTAFVRIHANLGRMRDGQAVLAWLYRTVVNLVRDRAKSARRKPLSWFTDLVSRSDDDNSEEYAGPPDGSLDPARMVESAQLHDALEQAIGALPLEFREPLVLHHLQHLEVDEIAEVLGLPIGTVKSRLARARGRLRNALAGWFENS